MNIRAADPSLPLYRQIYDSVAGDILRGEIRPGEILPPIRTVALELQISVISVKRAWEELERDGFITTAVGRGSFAATLTEEALREKRRALLLQRLSPAVAVTRALGASDEEVLGAVSELLKK